MKSYDTFSSAGDDVNWRFLSWIWHVRGSLRLIHRQSNDETFDRLAPLFHQIGTSHERTGTTLTFSKRDPVAQDKMSVFDGGVLQIENGATEPVLRYDLASRALLLCFLAPLLFVGLAQLNIAIDKFHKPPAAIVKPSGKAADASKKPPAKEAHVAQNPIDKALGAPAPEQSGKTDAEKSDTRHKKPSPTTAYVFAGIFAALYILGRILEDRLIRRLFRRRLAAS